MAEETKVLLPEVVSVQPKVMEPIMIQDYEKYVALVNAYLDERHVFEITDDESKKKAKKIRAEINADIEKLKRGRIDGLKWLIGTFEEQVKNFESLLDTRQKAFGVAIKKYEDEQKAAEAAAIGLTGGPVNVSAKTITITVKTTDPKVVEKIKKIALDNNCSIAIK